MKSVTSLNNISTLRAVRLLVRRRNRQEVNSAHNSAWLSPSDPACARLKPLGFVDTRNVIRNWGKGYKKQLKGVMYMAKTSLEMVEEFKTFIDFVQELKTIDEEHWNSPISEGKWSLKDVISHIMLWDKYFYEEPFL